MSPSASAEKILYIAESTGHHGVSIFTTLPADANPLDPALVAPALALDPNLNRRRLGRRMPKKRGWMEEISTIYSNSCCKWPVSLVVQMEWS